MAETYSVESAMFSGEEALVLRDAGRRSEAWVLPGVGANCFAFRVEREGDLVPLLYEPPDAESLRNRPSGFGIPILFPFPNRVEEGRFSYGDQDYLIPPSEGQSHAIHGFVMGRRWSSTVTRARDDTGAMVRCEFRSSEYPELANQYPSSFEAAVIVRLKGGILWVTLEAVNTGNERMPAGIGFHPYFPLPFRDTGDRATCTVQMPASAVWPLREDCIPTGELIQVQGEFDLRNPRRLGDRTYDHVWSALTCREGWSRSSYRDPEAQIAIHIDADESFRELVLFAPDTRPVICVEPYTCTTNALNLNARGADAGLVHLEPGERIRGVMRIAALLEPLEAGPRKKAEKIGI